MATTKRNATATPATPATPAAPVATPATGTVAAPLQTLATLVAAAQANAAPLAVQANKYATAKAIATATGNAPHGVALGVALQASAGRPWASLPVALAMPVAPAAGTVPCAQAYAGWHGAASLWLAQYASLGVANTWVNFLAFVAGGALPSTVTAKIAASKYGPAMANVAAGTACPVTVATVAGHLRGYANGCIKRGVLAAK